MLWNALWTKCKELTLVHALVKFVQLTHWAWSHFWSFWMKTVYARTQDYHLLNGHLITLPCWLNSVASLVSVGRPPCLLVMATIFTTVCSRHPFPLKVELSLPDTLEERQDTFGHTDLHQLNPFRLSQKWGDSNRGCVFLISYPIRFDTEEQLWSGPHDNKHPGSFSGPLFPFYTCLSQGVGPVVRFYLLSFCWMFSNRSFSILLIRLPNERWEGNTVHCIEAWSKWDHKRRMYILLGSQHWVFRNERNSNALQAVGLRNNKAQSGPVCSLYILKSSSASHIHCLTLTITTNWVWKASFSQVEVSPWQPTLVGVPCIVSN